MLEQFHDIADKLANLEGRLSDPSLINNQQEYQKVVKEHAHLSRLAELIQSHKDLEQQIGDNRSIVQDEGEDEELRELARLELDDLQDRFDSLETEIQLFLLPKDPNDDKNIFLEIRAGTGGDEAALFVGDLFRMYTRYAESMGWNVEIITSSPLGIGGFKEIIGLVRGDQFRELSRDPPDHLEAGLPSLQGEMRLESADLRFQLGGDLRAPDIGRVRTDERKHPAVPEAAPEISPDQVQLLPDIVPDRVFVGYPECRCRYIDSRDPGTELASQNDADYPASTTEVETAQWCNPAVTPGQDHLQQEFGLRSRYQHVRRHMEWQGPEFALAEDVGHRFAATPPRDILPEPFHPSPLDRLSSSEVELCPGLLQTLAEQQFGIEPGLWDSGRLQAGSSLSKQLSDA